MAVDITVINPNRIENLAQAGEIKLQIYRLDRFFTRAKARLKGLQESGAVMYYNGKKKVSGMDNLLNEYIQIRDRELS